MHTRGSSWRALAGEGRGLGFMFFQARQQLFDLRRAIAGADPADIDELRTTMDADEQRAEFAGRGRPAADDDLMAGAAFRLGPAIAAAGDIGRIAALRNDALQGQATGGFQHRIAACLEMLDIAQGDTIGRVPQQRLKPLLARKERLLAPILAVEEQQIEGEEDEIFGLFFR